MRRRSSRRRRRTNAVERLDLIGVIACAAGAALFANPTSATAHRAVALVISAAVAGIVTLAGARARRWSVIWLAGVAAVGAVGSIWAAPALLALVIGGVAATARRRSRFINTIIAALAIQAVLRFPDVGPQGLPTAIGLVATVPILASAYRASSSATRRIARRASYAVGAFVAVAVIVGGATGLLARGSLADGIDAADEGLRALEAGDQASAATHFGEAEDSFGDAATLVGGPWTWPSRVVPGLAPNMEALHVAAEAGGSVATTAAITAQLAPYADVTMVGGSVDVDKLAAMAEPVRQQSDVLRASHDDLVEVGSPWLLPTIATPIGRLTDGIASAQEPIDRAAALVRVAPQLLGANGTSRYLVALTTLDTSAYSGGAIVAYGELTAVDGRVTMTGWAPVENLAAEPGSAAESPGERAFLDRYGRLLPHQNPGALLASPDLPTGFRVLSDRFGRSGLASIDGVIVVDPVGLAVLLEITGPIPVVGLDQPLTAETVDSLLITDPAGGTDRPAPSILVATGDGVGQALFRGTLPETAALGAALSDSVRDGHLRVAFADPDLQAAFSTVGATGALPDPEGGDAFSVRTARDGGAAIDESITRSVRYDAVVDPETRRVDATATITFTNAATPEVLASPAARTSDGSVPGTAALTAAFFTPLSLQRADLGGAPLPVEPQRELGQNVYSSKLSIAPGERVVVTLHLSGTVDDAQPYRLTLSNQPLATTQSTVVTVTPASGWGFAGGTGGEIVVPGAGTTTVAVDLERTS